MLNEKEFNILKLVKNKSKILDDKNVLAHLVSNKLLQNDNDRYCLTEEGLVELNKYKVDNAIIMAAGMSSRFVPLSYERPKGLLVVKGEKLIERQIKQLKEAGINDITVIVGYLKEQFFYLEEKFGVKIVVNDDYYRYNNTSSLIRVLDKINNTYICSSDNYFTENVFEEYVYKPYYAAVFSDKYVDEYCLNFDENNVITSVDIGDANKWYMLGHVYFDKYFSVKFKEILKEEYKKLRTREELWENLYMRYINDLSLYIRKYPDGIIYEFDSLRELQEFDMDYLTNTNSKIIENICTVLKCQIAEIKDIKVLKAGMTNMSFVFSVNNTKYVYRHPGIGTEAYINRRNEAQSIKYAKKLRLDETCIFMDENEGWKISYFIDEAHTPNLQNWDEVAKCINLIKRLHEANIQVDYKFDVWKSIDNFINKIKANGFDNFNGFYDLYNEVQEIYQYVEKDGWPKCLCHCDCFEPNFLLTDKTINLIDWEYSGYDDPGVDLGTFICCSDYNYEEAMRVLNIYFGRKITDEEIRHYMGYICIMSYCWYLWAIYQESLGKNVGEHTHIWYKLAKYYREKTKILYSM